jgi:hypothetical protein
VSFRGLTLQPALHHRRKALPLIFLSPLLPPRAMPERPIFIVGCPRSGTSILYQLLRRLPETSSLGGEGHALWETFHHPRAKDWSSNALDATDVGSVERRYVAWGIRLLAGKGRFVDKTPRNVLRLPYLDALFPDAHFVFLFRDGRALVSSLIIGWRRRPEPSYVVPAPFRVRDVPDRYWHYVLPPGWRELDGRPVEDACALQYTASLEAMLSFRDRLDPSRCVELRYEDLVADPTPQMERVHRDLDLPFGPKQAERVRAEVRAPTGPPKWSTLTPLEIERVLPTLEPMLARTGYPTN